MTMPIGSVEEPTVEWTEEEAFPVRLVSSDAKPQRSVGAEFGRWRTIPLPVASAAQRIAGRALTRKRLLIKVSASSIASQSASQANEGTQTGPAAGTTITSLVLTQGVYAITWQVGYGAGAVAAAEANNMQLLLGAALVETAVIAAVANTVQVQQSIPSLIVGAGGATLAVKNIALATATAVYEAQIVATPAPSGGQAATDGIFLADRDTANNTAFTFSLPGFQNGGLLQIGDSLRWECQQELWAVPQAGNTGTVYVSVCDERYASDSK